jgi:hypothetical protein
MRPWHDLPMATRSAIFAAMDADPGIAGSRRILGDPFMLLTLIIISLLRSNSERTSDRTKGLRRGRCAMSLSMQMMEELT